MQTLLERGCGLDVHQATVVACLLIVRNDGKVQKQMQTFATITGELVKLRVWLLGEGRTQVAMRARGCTGSRSSKPSWKEAIQVVVANAQHVKKVPGRKTDVKDAEWLADLLCHWLLSTSFVSP